MIYTPEEESVVEDLIGDMLEEGIEGVKEEEEEKEFERILSSMDLLTDMTPAGVYTYLLRERGVPKTLLSRFGFTAESSLAEANRALPLIAHAFATYTDLHSLQNKNLDEIDSWRKKRSAQWN